jgi:glycosyltransferase involved in cell wall biosynthesis
VGLNLLHARPAIGGGWQYIENVLAAVARFNVDCNFIAYCTEASAELVPKDSRFEIRTSRCVTSWQPVRVLYEQTILVAIARRDRLDCMHWFAVNRSLFEIAPAVVTLYDCICLEKGEAIGTMQRQYLRRMVKFACGRAQVVAAISESTAQSALRLLPVQAKRVFVVPNPVDERYRPAPVDEVVQFRRQFGLPNQFWVYVAHPYSHKNHARLLAAYRKFRDRGGDPWPLVLRADRKADWVSVGKVIQELGLDNDVLWLPRLSTADIVRLYSAAAVLIFPSLYEGCGQPVMEAMACGCPVAASDIPTCREFGGSAAFLFDPFSTDAIAGAMQRMSTDAALRERCRGEGFAMARKYSQEKAALTLIEAYRQAICS